MNVELRESILQMSPADRIALALEIWESVEAEAAELPLTQAQKAELDWSLADVEANPDDELSWDAAKAELRSRP
ncbi:MAG: addiction module protein [Acidobacteria bacterium]|nr:addiction module protein [Acidobacteriota bacterium]